MSAAAPTVIDHPSPNYGARRDAPIDLLVLHNPGYDFNDQALPFGAAYFVNVVEKKLARR